MTILKLTITTFLIFCTLTGKAQSKDSSALSKNAVYIELFGSAGYMYNLSYDKVVFKHNKNALTLGLGIQYNKAEIAEKKLITMSPQVNYLFGMKNNFLEGGLGYYLDFADPKDNSIIFRLGYRYQKRHGLFFKIGVTPVLTKSFPIFGQGLKILPWAGVALGFAF